MASYDSNLKTWGATGTEYPSGYSYLEGEQPVDGWDNFVQYNSIEDISHLIELTNKRIESDSGSSHPSSPEPANLSYRTDTERLYHYDATASSWHGLLKIDGDTLQGSIDVNDKSLTNVGLLELSGNADVAGNDVTDTVGGTTLYDSTNTHIPLSVLEASQVTVNAGSHLSGTDTISLGGSVTLDVDDDFVLNAGDTMSGELIGERAASSRIFTASDSTSGDKFSLRVDGDSSFELVGYDSSAGTWNYASSLSYDPGNESWEFGTLPAVSGDNVATQSWVNASASVPNADDADTLDGFHASELGLSIEEDGTSLVGNSTGIDFTGHLNVTDDGDGTVTIDPTHDHDGRYARLYDGVKTPVYSSFADVPSSISIGELVFIPGEGLYVEDGT